MSNERDTLGKYFNITTMAPKKRKDDIYTVSRLIDVKEVAEFGIDTVRYRLRWKGFMPAKDTWEPYENLSEDCQEAALQLKAKYFALLDQIKEKNPRENMEIPENELPIRTNMLASQIDKIKGHGYTKELKGIGFQVKWNDDSAISYEPVENLYNAKDIFDEYLSTEIEKYKENRSQNKESTKQRSSTSVQKTKAATPDRVAKSSSKTKCSLFDGIKIDEHTTLEYVIKALVALRSQPKTPKQGKSSLPCKRKSLGDHKDNSEPSSFSSSIKKAKAATPDRDLKSPPKTKRLCDVKEISGQSSCASFIKKAKAATPDRDLKSPPKTKRLCDVKEISGQSSCASLIQKIEVLTPDMEPKSPSKRMSLCDDEEKSGQTSATSSIQKIEVLTPVTDPKSLSKRMSLCDDEEMIGQGSSISSIPQIQTSTPNRSKLRTFRKEVEHKWLGDPSECDNTFLSKLPIYHASDILDQLIEEATTTITLPGKQFIRFINNNNLEVVSACLRSDKIPPVNFTRHFFDAVTMGRREMCLLLLPWMRTLYCEDQYGDNPLSIAARWGDKVLANHLLKMGIDSQRLNFFEQTPHTIAREAPHPMFLKFLSDWTRMDKMKRKV